MDHIQIATDETIKAIMPSKDELDKLRAQSKAAVARMQGGRAAVPAAKPTPKVEVQKERDGNRRGGCGCTRNR